MYSPGTVYQQHSNLQQQISSDQSDYQADRSNTSESGIGINNSGMYTGYLVLLIKNTNGNPIELRCCKIDYLNGRNFRYRTLNCLYNSSFKSHGGHLTGSAST